MSETIKIDNQVGDTLKRISRRRGEIHASMDNLARELRRLDEVEIETRKNIGKGKI